MENKYILSIESSCDETSAAVVVNGREVLSNVIASQIDTHKKFGGVVPEVASRMHIEVVSGVVQEALDEAGNCKGIKSVGVVEDTSELERVYDPTHVDADEDGYVTMPNVNILNEMADMIVATRTYEANADAYIANKSMFSTALTIGK